MVTYSREDIIPFSDFHWAWRFDGPPWGELTESQRAELLPLSKERSADVFSKGLALRGETRHSVNLERYHVVARGDTSGSDEETLEFLTNIPIAPSAKVYVTWYPDCAVVTTWQLFIEKWDDLYYPFDFVNVFDNSLDWGLLMGPEEEFCVYLERNRA